MRAVFLECDLAGRSAPRGANPCNYIAVIRGAGPSPDRCGRRAAAWCEESPGPCGIVHVAIGRGGM